MSRFISYICIFAFLFWNCNNSNRQQVNKDNTFFINLVEQWNKAHNDKNIEQFPWKFIGILIPTALGDSINPCAFAVMLLLLSTILSKSKSRKRTIFSGVLFSLAIFLSYFLMGI